MEIRFLGPLGKVTGSCAWMRDLSRGWSFLIDCGMQQGEHTSATWNRCEEWPFEPSELQFIVLTHAHVDHSGLIAALDKRGFRGSVYCTAETRDIAKLLLLDSATCRNAGHTPEDVAKINWHVPGNETKLGGYHPVDDDLWIRFFRSGHIIGATSVTIAWGRARPNAALHSLEM